MTGSGVQLSHQSAKRFGGGQQAAMGICVLRDCRDLVPFLCGHYLRMGLDQIRFFDDGSTDGTARDIAELAEREPRIRLRRLEQGPTFWQARVINAAVDEAVAEGFRFILPFDADEFWDIEPSGLAHLCADPTPRVICGRWVNFAQRREITERRSGNLLSMTHRLANPSATQDAVIRCLEPFIAFRDQKAAIMSDGSAIGFEPGQHAVASDAISHDHRRFDIFHVPLRSRSELFLRAEWEERRAGGRKSPGYSWQSAFHADMVQSGRSDVVWNANSVDSHGCIDVFGNERPLNEDLRLLRLLSLATEYLSSTMAVTDV